MTIPDDEKSKGGVTSRQKARNPSGKTKRLMSLPFIGRVRRRFPNKNSPRVVLLQGPVGSFFRRAQDHLNANGFDAWRVCFNAGDRLFSRGEKSLNFSGSAEIWRAWFNGILSEHGFDAVVLFGADRIVHRIALECAEQVGIPVLCLEEGYIRPGYVTMELGGNNWRSPIAGQLPPDHFNSPRKDGPKAVPAPGSFSAMAWCAFQYFTLRALISTPGERKLFHKQKRTLLSEGFYWFKNYYRKFAHVGRNYRISERLLEHHDKRFFIVPLQVHDDTQLGRAANSWNNQKLILKTIVSFARNAPEDHQLVFKIHPMERGHTRDRNFIRQVSALNDVRDRVHVLDGGSLSLLTRHSAGMITINSTSGLSALHHGVPLAVMGQALYRHSELAFCVERGMDLDRFWNDGCAAPDAVRQRYLSWIQHECLVGGDFYAKDGMEAAVGALRLKIESALENRAPVGGAAGQVIVAAFGQTGKE
ncbi:capsular biosynthesis protein [Rhizobium sp. KVB221]|uniref:Capsular biosynthesis protein n=1 Tax=Rhizobium setariae TaxID=2801340 RepID=A0A936YPZ1_9HYPH|nr:capsular biosynthesis protein [Rhizobium setariae]MBL0372341.1 capsular biosynthesis protein [Rhizobium setariae]